VADQELEASPLFVAATRPAMVLGLPIGLAVVFMMAVAAIMITVQNPFYELALIPAWIVAREVVRLDYNGVRIAQLWLETKVASFDAHRWGGASPSPFPIRPGRHPRGIGSHAW
jgi:type IV secretion system protein VirB3